MRVVRCLGQQPFPECGDLCHFRGHLRADDPRPSPKER